MGFGSKAMTKSQSPRWCFATEDYNERQKNSTTPCIDCQNKSLMAKDSVVNC